MEAVNNVSTNWCLFKWTNRNWWINQISQLIKLANQKRTHDRNNKHCVKSVQIRSFFWSVFFRIWTEYGEILRISPYLSVSLRIQLAVFLRVPSLTKVEVRNFLLLHFSRWPCLIYGQLAVSLRPVKRLFIYKCQIFCLVDRVTLRRRPQNVIF